MSGATASTMLEGVWKPIGAWLSGRELDLAELRVARLEFDATNYRIIDRAGDVVDHGRYRLDRHVSPTTLDFVGEAGINADRTLEAVVDLGVDAAGRDQLTLCYDVDSGPRPEAVLAPGEHPGDETLILTLCYARVVRRTLS